MDLTIHDDVGAGAFWAAGLVGIDKDIYHATLIAQMGIPAAPAMHPESDDDIRQIPAAALHLHHHAHKAAPYIFLSRVEVRWIDPLWSASVSIARLLPPWSDQYLAQAFSGT
jgi:hypothetical protein